MSNIYLKPKDNTVVTFEFPNGKKLTACFTQRCSEIPGAYRYKLCVRSDKEEHEIAIVPVPCGVNAIEIGFDGDCAWV